MTAHISPMSISRIYIKTKNDNKRTEVKSKIKIKPGSKLYIFVDDAWVRVDRYKKVYKPFGFRSVNRTKVQIITFCTGHDPKTIFKRKKT